MIEKRLTPELEVHSKRLKLDTMETFVANGPISVIP